MRAELVQAGVCYGEDAGMFAPALAEEPAGEISLGLERAGGFEPLRFLPKGKHVVLGLVTSKTGVLENKDDIKRRIDEASKFVSLDQLCLSPQCGFASTEEGNILTEDEQWAKLRLVVDVANDVWGR